MPMLATQPIDIACDDDTDVQRLLNDLYGYKDDVSTKVYHRSRVALFQRIVENLIAQGVITNFGSALDIGCNAGFYSKLISDFGFEEVLGIDLDSEQLMRANRTFASSSPDKSITFKMTDATALPHDKTYDFILCTEVIEHTDNPSAVVEAITTLLAPGGVAVVSLPNCLSIGFSTAWIGSLLRRNMSQDLWAHLQYPFFKGPALFKRSGVRVIYTAGVNCLFNNRSLGLLYRAPFFNALNRVNFWLSARWPMRGLSQFFFFVLKKDAENRSSRQ
jgi:2-polyprenyl-3-methyl-5-hydroxy-6-metoxy-1,4-benzoquinol methylase